MFFLEGQTNHAKASSPDIEHRFDGPLQMRLIAVERRFKQRKMKIQAAGAIRQRAQILRQARSAEGEARFKVGRRNVQSACRWQRVSMTSLASMLKLALKAPISFANEILTAWKALQAYLIISAVRRADHTRSHAEAPIEAGNLGNGVHIIAADNHQRRFHKVFDGCSFPQELRIRDNCNQRMLY